MRHAALNIVIPALLMMGCVSDSSSPDRTITTNSSSEHFNHISPANMNTAQFMNLNEDEKASIAKRFIFQTHKNDCEIESIAQVPEAQRGVLVHIPDAHSFWWITCQSLAEKVFTITLPELPTGTAQVLRNATS